MGSQQETAKITQPTAATAAGTFLERDQSAGLAVVGSALGLFQTIHSFFVQHGASSMT